MHWNRCDQDRRERLLPIVTKWFLFGSLFFKIIKTTWEICLPPCFECPSNRQRSTVRTTIAFGPVSEPIQDLTHFPPFLSRFKPRPKSSS